MPALFEIGASFGALDCLLDEIGGDVSDPAVDAVVTNWFAELASQEAEKLENYCQYVRRLEMEAAAAKAEAEQFQAKVKTRENRVKWLKDRMKVYLESQGRKEAVTSAGRKIAFQANGGKTPILVDDTVSLSTVPPVYLSTTIAIDRDAVRTALEGGTELPFARFGDRGTQLRIRT